MNVVTHIPHPSVYSSVLLQWCNKKFKFIIQIQLLHSNPTIRITCNLAKYNKPPYYSEMDMILKAVGAVINIHRMNFIPNTCITTTTTQTTTPHTPIKSSIYYFDTPIWSQSGSEKSSPLRTHSFRAFLLLRIGLLRPQPPTSLHQCPQQCMSPIYKTRHYAPVLLL